MTRRFRRSLLVLIPITTIVALVGGPHFFRFALSTGMVCSPAAGAIKLRLADPWLPLASDRSWFIRHVLGKSPRANTVYAFRVEGLLAPKVSSSMTISDLPEQERASLLKGVQCVFVDVRVGRLIRICTTAPAKLFVDRNSGAGIVTEDEAALDAIVMLKRSNVSSEGSCLGGSGVRPTPPPDL